MAEPDTAANGARAPERAYYDAFSPNYERERHHGYHLLVDDLEARTVTDHLRPGDRVLEIGCGTGLIMQRLRNVCGTLAGIDLSSGMIRIAAGRGLRVAVADATAIPMRSGAFDLVCSFKVLPHVREIGRALEEIDRVAAPGARLVLEFYNPHSVRGLLKRYKRPTPVAAGFDDEAIHTRYDSLGAALLRLPAGWRLLEVRGIRIVTPAAAFHRLPGVGTALRLVERALWRGPAARFGGFLLLVCRKGDGDVRSD